LRTKPLKVLLTLAYSAQHNFPIRTYRIATSFASLPSTFLESISWRRRFDPAVLETVRRETVVFHVKRNAIRCPERWLSLAFTHGIVVVSLALAFAFDHL
jgi:hypothetical protein